MRHLPLRARAADIVDAGFRSAADFRVCVVVKAPGLARVGWWVCHLMSPQYALTLSMLKLYN